MNHEENGTAVMAVENQVSMVGMVARKPATVLAEAAEVAQALAQVLQNKRKPVIISGEQYLEFEDWQTVARFYGHTVGVTFTRPVEINGALGYEAGAEVYAPNGQFVSRAEAMCLNDEDKWTSRAKYEFDQKLRKRVQVGFEPVPLFQLRSMAQTRACAKAIRNVFAWVVVLGGFKATPAEEMVGFEREERPAQQAQQPRPAQAKPEPEKDFDFRDDFPVPPDDSQDEEFPPLEQEIEMTPQDRLWAKLMALAGGNERAAADQLESLTSFVNRQTGDEVRGKRKIEWVSEKAAIVALRKLAESQENERVVE